MIVELGGMRGVERMPKKLPVKPTIISPMPTIIAKIATAVIPKCRARFIGFIISLGHPLGGADSRRLGGADSRRQARREPRLVPPKRPRGDQCLQNVAGKHVMHFDLALAFVIV